MMPVIIIHCLLTWRGKTISLAGMIIIFKILVVVEIMGPGKAICKAHLLLVCSLFLTWAEIVRDQGNIVNCSVLEMLRYLLTISSGTWPSGPSHGSRWSFYRRTHGLIIRRSNLRLISKMRLSRHALHYIIVIHLLSFPLRNIWLLIAEASLTLRNMGKRVLLRQICLIDCISGRSLPGITSVEATCHHGTPVETHWFRFFQYSF